MRDKFLSTGLLKSILRRFWPLWLVYFVALVLLLVAPLYSAVIGIASMEASLEAKTQSVADFWSLFQVEGLIFAFVAAIVVALSCHDHLWNGRAATFVGSLPLTRRTVFATHYAAGLVALLVVPALAALCLVPLGILVGPVFPLGPVAVWYALMAAVTFVLYAYAQLACQLAGMRAVALLLYVAFNFIVVCFEIAVRFVMSTLMFGLSDWGVHLDWLAPVVGLGHYAVAWEPSALYPDWRSLAAYCVVAAVVTGASAWLFARRDLEVAGEAVAFPVERPVLKYLAGASMALIFSSIFCLLRLMNDGSNLPASMAATAGLAAVMVVGGCLGTLFAEMVMSRSTHVLARSWRSGLALALASVALVCACRWDLMGVVRHVPDPGEVESVTLSCDFSYDDRATFTSPEAIATVCDLHRDIVTYGEKASSGSEACYTLLVSYALSGGRTLERTYPIYTPYYEYKMGTVPADEGALLIDRYAQMADSPEGRESRFGWLWGEDASQYAVTLEFQAAESGEYASLALSPSDQADLVENALRLDLMEEATGEALPFYQQETTTLNVSLGVEDVENHYMMLARQLSEEQLPHTVAWVRAHYPEYEIVPHAVIYA